LLACLTYPPAATQRTFWRLMTLTIEAQVIDLETEHL